MSLWYLSGAVLRNIMEGEWAEGQRLCVCGSSLGTTQNFQESLNNWPIEPLFGTVFWVVRRLVYSLAQSAGSALSILNLLTHTLPRQESKEFSTSLQHIMCPSPVWLPWNSVSEINTQTKIKRQWQQQQPEGVLTVVNILRQREEPTCCTWITHQEYYSALETGKPMDVTLVSAESLPVSGCSLQSLNTVMGDKHQGDLQSHGLRDHQVLRPSSARQLLLGYIDCLIHANLVCPQHTPSVLSF